METHRTVHQTWTFSSHDAAVPAPPSCTQDSGARASEGAEFRRNLQRCRLAKEWSIAQVSEAVHCSAQDLADYERGEGVVDREVEGRLKRLFKL
jgi:hypothetical protein